MPLKRFKKTFSLLLLNCEEAYHLHCVCFVIMKVFQLERDS